MLTFLTALLGVAKPILDEVYFNSVMAYVHDYVENSRKMEAELSNWPNIDDQLMGHLKLEKIRLGDALEKQAALIQAKPA